VVGERGDLVIWDVESGDPVTGPIDIRGGVSACGYSPTGRHIAYSARREVTIRDPDTGSVVARTWVRGSIKSLAWRPDGHAIAVGDSNGRVYLFVLENLADTPFTLSLP
jgi:WD40 repeat protein